MSGSRMQDSRNLVIFDLKAGLLTLNNQIGLINLRQRVLVVVIYQKYPA
jgi:hypothetical protein